MNEKLLMEVVRMLRERDEYYDAESKNAVNHGENILAAMLLGKSLAYDSAREMLMAALTDNAEILHEYDYFWQGENPTE